jgi:glycosyltransferase involved in cell wall biosynthesis
MLAWTATPERYYAAMDCLVAPSRIEETFGRVVVEAQACAVPVVAIASAGMAEAFLPGISGVPLRKVCAEEVGEAILSVRDNPLLREQLVDHGLAFASRFEMDEIARSFVRILDAA